MNLPLAIAILYSALLVSASTLFARNNTSTGFVKVKGDRFTLDDKLYRFYGTNAYWIQMTTDDDMDDTFHSIATAGYSVVRTWAFNDVLSKPSSGPYFQVLGSNGGAVNTGADGLQRLDKVVRAAQKYGVRLLFSLTNNWNPDRPMPNVAWNRRANDGALPRGYLSNDYGGMDAYVRAMRPGGTHDAFYTDEKIINAFKAYVSVVVKRYADSPTVLGWELGNDLRCASTVAASANCNTGTITGWVALMSAYIKSLDKNHIVTAGDGGFYCLQQECKKKYAKSFTNPSPLLSGKSFDGSYGVDTEDILAVPHIDFGSFQLFPDQVEYFPPIQGVDATVKALGDGGKWVTLHSRTAVTLGKPEALTAMSLVDQANWETFTPFDAIAPIPKGSSKGGPCGAEGFQVDYAVTAWTASAINGHVGGVLEYQWAQKGLTSHGTTYMKRALTDSPKDGSARYSGPANGQNAELVAADMPPI